MKICLEKFYGLINKNAFFIAIILSVLVITVNAPVYFRQYVSKDQDALTSAHAHGFAMTNFVAASWKNPFVAKEIDIANGQVAVYNHWPNGFFATFALVIKVFGNTEMTGRGFAIVLNLIGLFLLAAAFSRKNKIVFLAVPMILLSRMGRDAVPFVFLDAALFLFIGLIVYSISLLDDEKKHDKARKIFLAASIIGPFFCQLIAVFSVLAIPVFYYFDRNKKRLVGNLFFVFMAIAAAMIGMSYSGHGFLNGFSELWKQFLYRSSINTSVQGHGSEYVGFFSLFETIGKHLLLNLNFLVVLIPFAWWHIFKKKSPVVYFLPATLIYSLLMRNYVGIHYFAGLPLVAAAVFTVMLALSSWLEKKNLGILFLVLLIISATGVALVPEKYRTYKDIKQQRDLYAVIAVSQDVQSCRSFDVVDPSGKKVDYRFQQFFLGPAIIKKINKNEGGENCLVQVDFAAEKFSITKK